MTFREVNGWQLDFSLPTKNPSTDTHVFKISLNLIYIYIERIDQNNIIE